MNWDATTAECHVFTYKQGLLSRVAHDLKIAVTKFDVSVEDGVVEAIFDAGSLRTQIAMKRGKQNPGALSASDLNTIDDRIREVVLHSTRHPKIRFFSEGSDISKTPWSARGTLELHGVSRPLSASIRTEQGSWIARVQLSQPEFGIPPFTAMMGALKIKPDVDIVLRCSLPR